MESSSFAWDFFNHRLSHLQLGVDDSDAVVSVIGGTSTTNVFVPLDDGCDPSTCDEFPAFDNAIVSVGWASTTSKRAVFGAQTVAFDVDRDGATASVTVPLEEKGKGTPVAILRGYTFDTQRPLSGGTACYRPENGWHPRRMSIALGEPVLSDDRRSVTVDVTGVFEAGPTLDPERMCIDAVYEQAVVGLEVDVFVVVTKQDAETIEVGHDLAYAFSGDRFEPGEQPPPDLADRALGTSLSDPLVGWSAFDFRFNQQGETRGAYLRTFELLASPLDDVASGHATNFSPGTQLAAFDYAFTGRVEAVETGSEIERGTVDQTIEVALDDEGRPVVERFPL
jgi:hypothetical protein